MGWRTLPSERARALALEEALSVTFGRYVKGEGRKALTDAYFVDMRLEVMAVMVGGLVGVECQLGTTTSSDTTWVVSGSVSSEGGRWIPSSMVVNRRSSAGEFIGQDMEFLVRSATGATRWCLAQWGTTA